MNFDEISEPLSRRLADGLGRLAAVSRQLDWQAAEAEGLSPTQADLLRYVVQRPEGVRLAAAAAHAAVRNATASEAVSSLERKDLLRKLTDPDDGRALLLRATARGRKLARRWPASFEPVIEGLSSDEQETLLRLVMKMVRSLQQRGRIAPQRSCVSCRFFRENRSPGGAEPHYCAFVRAPMADRHLRIDCAEHESAA